MIARLLSARFSYRLILFMLVATIPAMLGGTWILSRKAADGLRAAGVQKLTSTAENLANRVDNWAGDVARNLQLLSRHPNLTGMDPARQRELLQQFRKIYPQVTYAHTIGPDGINVARSDNKPPVDYHDREYFHRVMAGAPIARETILRSRSTGHPALNQAAPILDPAGKVLGVVVVGMDLHTLDDVVGAARYGRTGYSCVLDEQGRALAHPDLTYASGLQDLRSLPPVQGVLGDRVSRSYRFQDKQGIWWLAYAVPLSNGWSVVSFEEEAEVLAEAHHVLALAMVVMGVVAVVMISLTWLATRMVVRPIVRMTDTAMKIAAGDWERRIQEDRDDELGTLAKAFNKMVNQLESTYRSVEEKVVELSAALTERKQAEEALEKKEEEFRQAQKLEAVGALAGGVAHEFNNLLQAIRAFTTFAMKGLPPEDTRRQDLQEVLNASERATALTRQLLGFSRRQQFQTTDVRLNELLVNLKKMLQPLIGEQIELEMSLADGVGLVHADPVMIQQVVMNLCINARDAMPSGGKLLIMTENAALSTKDCQSYPDCKPGRYVRLTVSDTGTGIPPDVLKRIFEPFFSTCTF